MSSQEFLHFSDDPNSLSSQGAKLLQVEPQQFVNWRWQMKHQLQTQQDFAPLKKLSAHQELCFDQVSKLFRIGVTPYYAALAELSTNSGVAIQALPVKQELDDPLGAKDPLDEKLHSPVPEVVHLYPDRVAFCVAMLCPVYCRYCYRKRRDEEPGLHFNRKILDKGIAYIASNPAIKDVLITGGDPFIASDESLEQLLQKLTAIPHVEIIRFGTRTPVTLPYRVTKKLCSILSKYHPIWVNTHFNHADELSPEACLALRHLVDAGIPVGNQSVLLAGVNDSYEQMRDLCLSLVRQRVRPYYVFHAHLVEGTQHLRVSARRGLEIIKQLRGNVSGFAIPTFIVDTPSGKVPLHHNHILGTEGQDLILEDVRGEIWREKGAWT